MAGQYISRMGQVEVYTGKCFRIFRHEKGWKSFLTSGLIMILISCVTGEDMFQAYGQTRNGAFALVSACIWIGIFNSIRSICRERDIIKREHRTGLHVSSYIIAHMVFEAVICLGEAVIAALIVWIANISHYPEWGIAGPAQVELLITFFLIIYSSDAMGILISSVVKNENSAMTVMPFALIIQLVMAGTIFELSGVTKAVSSLTISRWGQAAICAVSKVEDMSPLYPDEYVSTVFNLSCLWAFLIVFTAMYGILSIISLEFIDNDKR